MKMDFYGNEKALEIIEGAIEKKRFSHAYMLYGPEGCGKRTLAKRFAQGILCKGKPSPCNQCSACKKVQGEIHPDFIVSGGKGGKNSFHVDEVRKLRADVYIRPNDGAYKVILLLNIENMSVSAANSLLKVLEEPPEHAVFLLTCTERSEIPSTIVSRCVPIGLFPLSAEQCADAVGKIIPDAEPDQISKAAVLSGGVIGYAKELVENPEEKKALETAFEITYGLTGKNELDIIIAMGSLGSSRDFSLKVLLHMLAILGLMLESRYSGKKLQLILRADSLSASQVIEIVDIIKDCLTQLENNGNLKLILTSMSSRIGKILQK